MTIKILNRFSGSTIFETGAQSLGYAIIAALKAGANLRSADLSGANLRSAKIPKRLSDEILSQRTIVPDGDLIGWKKLRGGTICKLRIPSKAARVGGLIGRKCRCEFADILEGSGKAIHNGMEYKEGETITPDKYDPNPLLECSHGIHFFITKQEAEAYT